ncbi:MAG: hypothetical protein ACC652_05455, partial [Acidimicrobiales bacterium]
SIDRLGASMIIAAVVITPLGLLDAVGSLTDPVALAAGIAVGVSSSVIPYVFDQFAMARLPRATYALFVALLPATAVAVAAIVLAQIPSSQELVDIALVIVEVGIHQEPPATNEINKYRAISEGSPSKTP